MSSDGIERDYQQIDESMHRLKITLDKLATTLRRRAAERQATRDYRFERLLDWARKVSAKTGIPLEGF